MITEFGFNQTLFLKTSVAAGGMVFSHLRPRSGEKRHAFGVHAHQHGMGLSGLLGEVVESLPAGPVAPASHGAVTDQAALLCFFQRNGQTGPMLNENTFFSGFLKDCWHSGK